MNSDLKIIVCCHKKDPNIREGGVLHPLARGQSLRVLLLHTTNFALMLFGLYSVFLFRISFYVAIPDMLYLVMILSSNKAHRLVRIGYTVFAMLVWLYLYIIVTDCATYPYTSKLLGIS